MKYFLIFWSLLVFALCGCSGTKQLPSEFSQQLSTADRLEVTNRYYLFGTTISGADVSSLTKAIKSARNKTLGADADCDWDAKFYAGTNYLAVIHLNRDVIMVEDVQYHDGTGFVMTFWQKLVKEATAR
jgi:hypothetical protein